MKVNNVKDLCLLLDDEALSAHQADNKMAAAEDRPLSPTSKEHCMLEKSYKQVHTHTQTHFILQGVCVLCQTPCCKS